MRRRTWRGGRGEEGEGRSKGRGSDAGGSAAPRTLGVFNPPHHRFPKCVTYQSHPHHHHHKHHHHKHHQHHPHHANTTHTTNNTHDRCGRWLRAASRSRCWPRAAATRWCACGLTAPTRTRRRRRPRRRRRRRRSRRWRTRWRWVWEEGGGELRGRREGGRWRRWRNGGGWRGGGWGQSCSHVVGEGVAVPGVLNQS